MRKILSIFLCLALIFIMTSCKVGTKDTGAAISSDSNSTSTSTYNIINNTANSLEESFSASSAIRDSEESESQEANKTVSSRITDDTISSKVEKEYKKTKENKDTFKIDTLNFAVNLFKNCYSKDKNTLISPISAELALAMTANGADGETKAQFEKLFGSPIEDLNKRLQSLSNTLQNPTITKVKIANSLWLSDNKNFIFKQGFLDANKKYYDAKLSKLNFSNPSSLDTINTWVSDNTDGLIPKMLNELDKTAVMYLINTILFDAEWKEEYDSCFDSSFYGTNGRTDIETLSSTEKIYIEDENSYGVIKPYKEQYSFMAILPKENLSIDKLVSSLTGDKLEKLYKTRKTALVKTSIPKFKSRFEINLEDVLKRMKLTDAFDQNKANFKAGIISKDINNNVFISKVLHKTTIEVGEYGTKASAATAIVMATGAAPNPPIVYRVYLNEPFIYAIIDNESGTPLFIGTVLNINS